MRPGNGSIGFTADLPVSVSKAIMDLVDESAGGIGAHIVITGVRVDPLAIGDAAVLAAATYTGRITARPSRTSLEFAGLGSWLDSYIDATITRSAGTPTQWLGDLLINSLTAGTVSGGSNVSKTFPAHITTRREALDTIAGLGGWEYRIRPNFTVDAGTNLFRTAGTAGTVVVTRKSEGPDGTYRGVDGSMLDQEIRVGNLATKAVALAEGQGVSIAKGSATASRALRAPLGGAATFVTVFSAPGEESANANTVAQSFLNLQGMRRKVNVSSKTHHLPRYMVPGDEVYAYDLAAGIVDTSNQAQFRGETIFPAKVRCLSYTWPIEQGCGVYIRSNAASGTYIDVTDWVAWETDVAWWTVGDWSPSNYGRVNRTDPEIEQRIGEDRAVRVMGWDDGPTSDTTGITTLSNVGMFVDFTADPSRTYRTTAIVSISQQTSASFPNVHIADGSNNSLRLAASNMAVNARQQIAVVHIESGISGSQRRQVQCSVAAGSMTVHGTSNQRGTIVVEDIGPA